MQAALNALAERMSGCSDVATVHKGGFGELAGQIAAEIGDAPALILLDPIGLKAIGASACKTLLHRAGKTDVFVIVDFTIAYRAAGQLFDDGEPDPIDKLGVTGSSPVPPIISPAKRLHALPGLLTKTISQVLVK